MSRQMNPAIFGDSINSMGSLDAFEPMPLFEGTLQGPTSEEVLETIEKARYQMDEALKSLTLRLDKTAQRTASVEERIKQIVVETQERFAFLAARLKEKQSFDSKIEPLIERHNQLVQNFELRITQAQRVIENQALQLSKQQELIDESRRQIERLKRL